jgi:GDP-4-dehydro-6-deoxy-D-mannose reductase
VRALITGGRGFVGGWLAEHLRGAGDEVVAIDREVEITDPTAVLAAVKDAVPDAVYHLAALAHVGESWDDPLRVLEVNVLGTAAVLAAARQCESNPRVLVTSSAEVYGAVTDPDVLPLSETAPTAPLTPYAASKLAAEAVCGQAVAGHGQAVIVVRPFNHIGPGQSSNFAVAALAHRIVTALADGVDHIAVGNLSARRDFTDVRDVVRAYRLLIERGEPGAIYNVCSGRDHSIQEVAESLLRQTGARLELRPDPDLVRPVDVPVLRGDPGRLHQVTGWKPEISLDQTLADVLEWWRQGAAPLAG